LTEILKLNYIKLMKLMISKKPKNLTKKSKRFQN
jgi:hypothetical protein